MSRPVAVFPSFVLEGITKHLMTGSAGNSELCFLSTFNVQTLRVSTKLDSPFPLGVSH